MRPFIYASFTSCFLGRVVACLAILYYFDNVT